MKKKLGVGILICILTVVLSVTAFAADSYNITQHQADNGTFTVSHETATPGEPVTITPTPNTGYAVERFIVGGSSIPVNNDDPYTFTMPDKNVIVEVSFAPISYDVASGTITNGNLGSNAYSAHYGETVTITPSPDDGYEVSTVTVTAADDSYNPITVTASGDNYEFTMPASNVTVSATFNQVVYTITEGEKTNGTFQVDKTTATASELITISNITPDTGYEVATNGVTLDGDGYDSVLADWENFSTYTALMPDHNVTVNVDFTPVDYTVSKGAETNGTFTVSPTTAHYGDTVTITTSPATDYRVGTVTVGNTPVTAKGDGTYTFVMPADYVTVDVSFTDKSSSIPTFYSKVTSGENGSVDVSSKRSKLGDTVTVTSTPDKGYVVDKVTVTYAQNGKVITVTDKGDGTYSYRQPGATVTVTVTFAEAEVPYTNPFTDVDDNDYFAAAVQWAVENKITDGTGDGTTFSPDTTCTRAEAVAMLWKAHGSPVVDYLMPFTDVAQDAWYAEAVRWAASEGITSGTGDATFHPDAPCTRSQMVAFQWIVEGEPVVNYLMTFEDVIAESWYTEAIRWAASEGITKGTGDTTFTPDRDCTRAEIVTLLQRHMVG